MLHAHDNKNYLVAPPRGERGLKYAGDSGGLTAAVGSLPLVGSVD